MRVLFASHEFRRTGAAIMLYRLVSALNSAEIEPLVISSVSGPLEEAYRSRAVPIRRLSRLWFGPTELLPVVHLIKTHRIELIHINTLINHWVCWAAVYCGVPFIWNIREFPLSAISRAQAAVAANARHIVFSSRALQRYYQSRLRLPAHSVIYNGVAPVPAAPQSAAQLRRRWNIRRDELLIVSVGTVYPLKGQDLLLAAFVEVLRQLPQARLLLAGALPGRYRRFARQLVAYCRRQGIERAVIFAGEQPDSTAVLSAADVYACASRTESFGISILEAMTAGVPVAAFAVGGVPELILHKQSGLLAEPENPSALAEALIFLLQRKEQAAQWAQAAQQSARTTFSLEKTAAGFSDLYRRYAAPPQIRQRHA